MCVEGGDWGGSRGGDSMMTSVGMGGGREKREDARELTGFSGEHSCRQNTAKNLSCHNGTIVMGGGGGGSRGGGGAVCVCVWGGVDDDVSGDGGRGRREDARQLVGFSGEHSCTQKTAKVLRSCHNGTIVVVGWGGGGGGGEGGGGLCVCVCVLGRGGGGVLIAAHIFAAAAP